MFATTRPMNIMLAIVLSTAPLCMAEPLRVSIIPKPVQVQEQPGLFAFTAETRILAESELPGAEWDAQFLADLLNHATGFTIQVEQSTESGPIDGAVLLTSQQAQQSLGDEGYTLEVTPSSIVIRATSRTGLLYGVQSLRQLLPPAIESRQRPPRGIAWEVPCVTIVDQPRFKWRGNLTDISRHFFSKQFLERQIDLLSAYKLNILHLHLSDDQGWRVLIDRYPKLTEVGAWRKTDETGIDTGQWMQAPDQSGMLYGGYFTKDDISEIVTYASQRGVTIVPEIEMPGHSLAALAAYPQYSCTGGPFEVGTRWGIQPEIFCAGNDETYQFLDNVLGELILMFPGPYFHIGGDEAPKDRWQACPQCQARIKAEGLKDETDLQSYFTRRIAKFLAAHGKRVIGWEEIIEGGRIPDPIVMHWHIEGGAAKAAREGYDVVMAPSPYTYLYHRPSPLDEDPPGWKTPLLPLERVYSFEPIPADLTPEQASHILGAQTNMWAEFVPTEARSDYLLLPRMTALAEVVWSPPQAKNFEDYQARLVSHYQRLDDAGFAFRIPTPEVTEQKHDANGATIEITPPFAGADVRYTLDGSNPEASSPPYTQAFEVRKGEVVKARTFMPSGRGSLTVEQEIK